MKKIEVLSELKWILKLTNLYSKNGVCIEYNRNGDLIKVPDFIVFCLILLPIFYLALLSIWTIIDEKFELKLISTTLACVIATTQVATAYISLAMKTNSIVSTIDNLQEVVEKSKWF